VSELYQSTFQLKGLGFFEVFVLCGGGALIGLLGAWVAVMQHLRAVEPK
jgi:cell division transport system permease protein